MRSPNGAREVVKSGYGEIRMGSPLFGQLVVLGGVANTQGRTFGEAVAFSSSSRFLAVEELMDTTRGPRTRAVVFDLEDGVEGVVHDQDLGFIQAFEWEADGTLTVTTWSHRDGRAVHRAMWRPPSNPALNRTGLRPAG
jgi:hypothetical protein